MLSINTSPTNKQSTSNSNNSPDIATLVANKQNYFQDVIQRTILSVQTNKTLGIINVGEVSTCLAALLELTNKLQTKDNNIDNCVVTLQSVNNDLSILFKQYGTNLLEDFLSICFGSNYMSLLNLSEYEKSRFEILKSTFHPTSYKVLNNIEEKDKEEKKDDDKDKKEKEKDKKDKVKLDEKSLNFDCCDLNNVKQFHYKVYGLQLIIHNHSAKKSLLVTGIIDDISLDFLNNKFISNKIRMLKELVPSSNDKSFKLAMFERYISSLTLKDIFINSEYDLYGKYAGYVSNLNAIKAKSLTQCVKDFITSDLFTKRLTIIQLLLDSEKYDNLYLAYLLFDLLSNDSNNNVDTVEQNLLLDSLPWTIKNCFKDAMKKTIQYTNELSNFDINKIPIEQQICLMKAPDQVKEKAMQKLKEVKAKSEDSGSKARQYLDGLLKIPFGVYKKEPILTLMDRIKQKFSQHLASTGEAKVTDNTNKTSLEIINYIKNAKKAPINIDNYLLDKDKTELVAIATKINIVSNSNKIKTSGKKKDLIKAEIKEFLQSASQDIITDVVSITNNNNNINKNKSNNNKTNLLDEIEEDYNTIKTYINSVKDTLDKSVYCHQNAKKQIERIIGQWITGENKAHTILGFEGAPGLGKTTLAKGLANCLIDENGQSRPFSLIAIGGDTNSSTLVGHSYTYVGSTWGQIVQILMDKKCMNPIILIDEVDKISRTEHGKEIIGVLTHLLDTTQNDTFQDKYFSGIELDLSKALFILSYNDVSALDRVMLDRITRIKFDALSVEDKIVISNKHLLPEIYKNVGLIETIEIPDDVLKFIIEEYTMEAGVRKLKEVLTELCREINLEILKDVTATFSSNKIVVTIDDIKNKYFKEKNEIIVRKVFTKSEVGFVNGMYATVLGNGGTLPIHAKFFPSNKFLELKLTGLQQDVMRESMNVALTVAWNLTNYNKQQEIRKLYGQDNNCYSLNIHTGDNAVSKDGPSAGCAITCALFSLLNNIPIKPEFGITGEIQMSGHVTAIGGLSSKILGSIKAGVKNFIYPKENYKDFDKFFDKYRNDPILTNIKFYPVDHVNEALELLLDK
jgi:ATP-dependent Lon protease